MYKKILADTLNGNSAAEGEQERANGHGSEQEAATAHPPPDPWPVLAEDALYDLADDIARAIDPFTEADSVAVLLNPCTSLISSANSGSG